MLHNVVFMVLVNNCSLCLGAAIENRINSCQINIGSCCPSRNIRRKAVPTPAQFPKRCLVQVIYLCPRRGNIHCQRSANASKSCEQFKYLQVQLKQPINLDVLLSRSTSTHLPKISRTVAEHCAKIGKSVIILPRYKKRIIFTSKSGESTLIHRTSYIQEDSEETIITF